MLLVVGVLRFRHNDCNDVVVIGLLYACIFSDS